jgi:hypothetical protein
MQIGLLMTEIWRFPGWGEIYNIIQERIEFRVEGKEVLAYSKLKKEKKKDYSGRNKNWKYTIYQLILLD